MFVFSPAHYAFNILAVPPLVAMLAILLLGVLVVARERVSLVSLSFFAVTVSVSVWLLGFAVAYSALDQAVARWWINAAYLGIPAIAASTYQFTVVVLGSYGQRQRLVWLGWTFAALFTAAALGTDALIAGVHHYWWGAYPRYGWLGAVFIVYFFAMLIASMVHYWATRRQVPPRSTRGRRIGALMTAFGVGYIASVDFVAVYGVPLYPFGYVAILGFVLLAARAIWVYRLVDITPAFAANQIIETMSDALFVLDADGVVRLVNRAGYDLLGCTPADLLGRPLAATVGIGQFQERFASLLRLGTIRDYEFVYQPQEGNRRTLCLSASVMREDGGEPVAVVCIARDITVHKQAEEEIRRLNATLEQRVAERTAQLEAANRELEHEVTERKQAETARARLLARERQRNHQLRQLADTFLMINSARALDETLQIIVQQAREIIGARWAGIGVRTDGNGAAPVVAVSRADLGEGNPAEPPWPDAVGLIASLETLDGSSRLTPDELAVYPVQSQVRRAAASLPLPGRLAVPLTTDDGRVLGLIQLVDADAGEFTPEDEAILTQIARMAAVEIENRRLYHEAQAAVRARETLLSVVSHDLRNLLAAIKPSVGLLQRFLRQPQPKVEQMQAGLARIEAAATRMSKLIDELLDVARLQANQPLELRQRPTDLVALAQQVAAVQQASTDRHQIRVAAAAPTLIGLWDAPRLERVLDNLVANAIKYSPTGGEITLEVAPEDDNDAWAVLVVRDQGIGIPPADLPYIFDWFRRATNVTDRISGTGIGLASARQVVEQHGGTIAVTSEEGVGSIFTVRLPLTTLADQEIKTLSRAAV